MYIYIYIYIFEIVHYNTKYINNKNTISINTSYKQHHDFIQNACIFHFDVHCESNEEIIDVQRGQ